MKDQQIVWDWLTQIHKMLRSNNFVRWGSYVSLKSEGTKRYSKFRWCQPEIALWWDGIQLDDREDWNEDWAIVDGAGYFDIQGRDSIKFLMTSSMISSTSPNMFKLVWIDPQETDEGGLVFVESNKLTVRYHEIPPEVIAIMKDQGGNSMH